MRAHVPAEYDPTARYFGIGLPFPGRVVLRYRITANCPEARLRRGQASSVLEVLPITRSG
jgi:hypothetical protein